jgi:predicted dehydrogenase
MLPSYPELAKIGIVGAGGIVKAAHLPAYKSAGINVHAIYDHIFERAESLAREFEIPKVFRSLDEFLEDSSLDIIDIAVPPEVQVPIALKAAGMGKHLLCQKPLARTAEEAQVVVNAADASGVKLAVNVSMRWAPANREIATAIREGSIGEIKSISFDVKYHEEWQMWPWLLRSDRLVVLFDMIHILDFTRALLGEPRTVHAGIGRSLDSPGVGETWADVMLEYDQGLSVHYYEDSQAPLQETNARYTVQGSAATMTGQFGVYYDLPIGRPDTMKIAPRGFQPSAIPELVIPGRWIPDAFSETMHALLSAIEIDSEPENSGRDHIKTLTLIESIYAAARRIRQ